MDNQPAAETNKESGQRPIFGSQSTFGGGTGFGGFSGVSFNQSTADDATKGVEDDGGDVAQEEECKAEFKPVVQLAEVETTTGEEDEETALEYKSKLYRFDDGSGEWKERGVGMVKILKHKTTGKYRLVMREEKTLKIRANHHILASSKLQEHAGNDKAWVWKTPDFAEGEQRNEMFCIRFGTVERAQEFKKIFEEAQEKNSSLFAAPTGKSTDVSKEEEAVKDLAKQIKEKVKVENGTDAK